MMNNKNNIDMEIKFKKISPLAKTPYRKYNVDAGFDLYCTDIIKTSKYIEYRTGISVEIPEGMVGLVFPRSSITNMDVMLKNSVGVIDSSYRGEIILRFSDVKEYSAIQKKDHYLIGDRIGQIVFLNLPYVTMIETDELSDTIRGEDGFGSTGNK